MKTKKESKNWKTSPEDKLSKMNMIRLRGGGEGEENPELPIIKGP